MSFSVSTLARIIIFIQDEFKLEIDEIKHVGNNRFEISAGDIMPLSGTHSTAVYYIEDGKVKRDKPTEFIMS